MRLRLIGTGDLSLFAAGAFLLLLVLAASTRIGEPLAVTALLGLAVFGLVVVAFAAVPHVAVAAMIPLFVALPAIKVLYLPWIGPLKDVVTVAAITAAGLTVVQAARGGRRIPGDIWLLALFAFILALYLLNIGGSLERTWGWAHGVRLFALPVLLLLVGLTLSEPRRTFRWAMTSLVATACGVAVVGILQQLAGPSRLVEFGWVWNANVRTIDGFLRSFGTLDEPFAYAAVLVFGLCAVTMWMPRRPITFAAGGLIAVGLALSVVRTAGLIAIALIAFLLARHGRTVIAVFLLAIVVTAAVTFIVREEATEQRVVEAEPSLFITLNGRTTAWKAVFQDATEIPLGQGVGEVGTARNRAEFKVTRSREDAAHGHKALVVDSGYFAFVADIGIVGLVAMLLLLGRVSHLARKAILAGRPEGWVTIALVASLALDAVTRESFTAFPTAYFGLLLTGLALAAARAAMDESADSHAAPAARRRARSRLGPPPPAAGLPRPGATGA